MKTIGRLDFGTITKKKRTSVAGYDIESGRLIYLLLSVLCGQNAYNCTGKQTRCEKLLAWIRSNGFYADIHAGAVDETHLEVFGEHLGQIVWK